MIQSEKAQVKKIGWEFFDVETEEGCMIKEREFGSENYFYNVSQWYMSLLGWVR